MDRARRKKLPIGVSDFRAIMLDNGYYVDKTRLVAKLLDSVLLGGALLFTHPRRFGKSLALDMLRCFFDCGAKEENRPLFEGLTVAQSDRYMSEQGKYPVLYMNLKDVGRDTLESTESNLRNALLNALSPFTYLLQSDKLSPLDKERLQKVLTDSVSLDDLSFSIHLVCSLLAKHHGQPTVILVDEYDAPLQAAYLNGFYKPVCDVMRNFFSSALKDNRHLRLGVITGVLRIAKESLFSGLNNLKVDTILSENYADCFGFTQAEVVDMAHYYAASDKIGELCEWYDGYRFGEQDIYNPWSVLQYFDNNCKAQAYWLDTSGNDLTKQLLGNLADKQHDQLLALYNDGSVEKKVDVSVTYQQLGDMDSDLVFSLLAVSGYLKPVKRLYEGQYRLMIPNKEIKTIYSEEILGHLQRRLQFKEIRCLRSAIIEGDQQRFADLLRKYLVASVSCFDTVEAFYHGWLLGLLLILDDEYTCLSNRESGEGRSDLMLMPRRGRAYPGMVFELKRSRTVRQMAEKAAEALGQIEDKDYISAFPPQVTEIVGYGIAFCRKRCEVVQKVWRR